MNMMERHILVNSNFLNWNLMFGIYIICVYHVLEDYSSPWVDIISNDSIYYWTTRNNGRYNWHMQILSIKMLLISGNKEIYGTCQF